MMEHSSVTLRWMGWGGGAGRGRREGKKGKADRKIWRFVPILFLWGLSRRRKYWGGVTSHAPCVFTSVVVNGDVRSWYVLHSPSEAWRAGRGALCVDCGKANKPKSVAWPVTWGACSEFMKASSHTLCVGDVFVHTSCPEWYCASTPSVQVCRKSICQNKSTNIGQFEIESPCTDL